MKTNPHLQKLLELVTKNISERFTIFGNAFRYLDFSNRQYVSYEDFSKGLEGFGLKLSPEDKKMMFCYLTNCQPD